MRRSAIVTHRSAPVAQQPTPRVARARLAVYCRDHRPAEEIERARADLNLANAQAAVEKIVASAPPLTDAQRARLALLLAPSTSGT
jgi:hypothetical protein